MKSQHRICSLDFPLRLRVLKCTFVGSYPAREGGGEGVRGLGCAMPRCRHIGCVITRGHRCVVLCCVVLCYAVLCRVVLSGIGFCLFDFCSPDHTVMTYVPCATMT